MEPLKSRIKRKQAGEIPSARPTKVGPTKKEMSVRQMLEDGAKEFLKNLNFTGASFPGPRGAGVPEGGATNSVLTKASTRDFDTVWSTISGASGFTVDAGLGIAYSFLQVVPLNPTATSLQNAVNFSIANGYIPVTPIPNTIFVFADGESVTVTAAAGGIGNRITSIMCPGGMFFIDNSAYTSEEACIIIQATSGNTVHGQFSDCVFTGNLNASVHIRVRGADGFDIVNCEFNLGITYIELLNSPSGGVFTEFTRIQRVFFRSGYSRAQLHYRKSGGDVSFHGSGLVGHGNVTNLKNGVPGILIDSTAIVYGAELSIEAFSAIGGSLLIQNNSNSVQSFHGHIGTESGLTTPMLLASGGAVFYAGSASFNNNSVLAGKMSFTKNIQTNSNGSAVRQGWIKSGRAQLTTGTNYLPVDRVYTGSTLNLLFFGTNYRFRYKMFCDFVTTGSDITLEEASETNDTAGYGEPFVSMNSSGQPIVTNNNWPATGITVYADVQNIGQDSINAPRLETNFVENFSVSSFSDPTVSSNSISVVSNTTPVWYPSARPITYTALDSGIIGGLTSGVTYYCIRPDATHVQLASTVAAAQASTAISLIITSTGTFALQI